MARIRTIKPEFWQNEQLAELPEHARLLAIALLNHSDDEGYFTASPQLVRAACFPFEEHSKNVLRSIQDLSSVGYIEVLDCGGKAVGRVCKFLEHQRIDKPQKSKLSGLFQSAKSENSNVSDAFVERSRNIPGVIREPSVIDQRLEQGTGNRGMEQGTGEWNREKEQKDRVSVSVGKTEKPEGVDQQHWDDWLVARKKKHRAGPPTKTAMARIESEAVKAGITIGEAIRIAAEKEWRGFEASWLQGLGQAAKKEVAW